MNHCPDGGDGMDFVPDWTWLHHSMKKLYNFFLLPQKKSRTLREGHHYKPGSKLAPESGHASTLILNLWPLGCCWNPPAHGTLLRHPKTVLPPASINHCFHHFPAKFLESSRVYTDCLFLASPNHPQHPLLDTSSLASSHFPKQKHLSLRSPVTSMLLNPVATYGSPICVWQNCETIQFWCFKQSRFCYFLTAIMGNQYILLSLLFH